MGRARGTSLQRAFPRAPWSPVANSPPPLSMNSLMALSSSSDGSLPELWDPNNHTWSYLSVVKWLESLKSKSPMVDTLE